jgi:hypothetical protein
VAEDEIVPGESDQDPKLGQVAHAVKLRKDVQARVAELHKSGEVRDRIVKALTEAIIAELTVKLKRAVEKREQMQRDLYRLKPDQVVLDVKGVRMFEGYSKAKLEELKKGREEMAKLDRAIGQAIDEANYEPLQKFIGG